jgi:hypothetical protein
MDYQWHDLVGNVGVTIILGCYFFAQTCALLILVSLIYNFNLSSFVIEIAWLAISGYGLLRWYRSRPG